MVMARSFWIHGSVCLIPMIPRGGGPSPYCTRETPPNTPRITFQDRLSKNPRNHAETSRFSTPVESSDVQSGSLCTWESVTGKPTIRGNPVITRRTRNRPVRGSLSHVQHPASRPDRGRLRPESVRPGERCIRHPFARHRRSDFNTFCPARPAPTACASGAGDG